MLTFKREWFKIGHRGAAGHAPENTIESFELALKMGVDAIEFDVRRGPGGIVVFHDATLTRLTNGVDNRLISEIPEIFRDSMVLGHQIPTLNEVLEMFGKRTVLNIELKEEGIADRVLASIQNRGLVDRVIVSAFDDSDNGAGDSSNWADLLWMKRKEPNLKIALLADRIENMRRAVKLAQIWPIHAVSVSKDTAFRHWLEHKELTVELHVMKPASVNSWAWTVNDPGEIKKALEEQGVNGIFSDYPDRLKKFDIVKI